MGSQTLVGYQHVPGCKMCTREVVATRHLMLPLAVMSLSVVFRVLPSRRERLCFTTWMSVLKPRAAPPTLRQIHQETRSGVLPSQCKHVGIVSAAMPGRPPLARQAKICIAQIGDMVDLGLLMTPALHAAQGLLCPES